MRRLGLESIVENPDFRLKVGAPLYRKHTGGSQDTHVHEDAHQASSSEGHVDRRHGLTKPKPVTAGPLVSIIVPSYNVEEYLQQGMATILSQSYQNLEIVVVDDGSSDSTGAIAEQIAQQDSRVKVVHKVNGGLGAARNTGLGIATGEFVTFVDADDELTPNAIEKLVESLERTGSDFAIGAIERYDSSKVWTPFWVELVHKEVKQGIRGTDFPEVIWDNIVCNKLYRRSAWDGYVGLFPVGVFYEDQECTAKLFARGATFDVLTDVTYRWYRRDDSSSISQQKHTIADLQSRISVARTVMDIVMETNDRGLIDSYSQKLLGDDFYTYCQQVSRAEDGYFDLLQSGAQELLLSVPPEALLGIEFDRRAVILTLVRGKYEDFVELLLQFEGWGRSWKTEIDGEGLLIGSIPQLPFLLEYMTPEERQILPETLQLAAEISSQTFDDRGRMILEGFAFVRTIQDTQHTVVDAAFERVDEAGSILERVALECIEVDSFWADSAARDALNSHEKNGFQLILDSVAVDSVAGPRSLPALATQWRLVIRLRLGDHEWLTHQIGLRMNGSAGALQPSDLTPGGSRVALGRRDGILNAIPIYPTFVLVDQRIENEILSVTFREARPALPRGAGAKGDVRLTLRLGGEAIRSATCEPMGEGLWTASLSLSRWPGKRSENSRLGELLIEPGNGSPSPLSTGERLVLRISDSLFSLESSSYGYIRVREFAQFALVNSVSLDDDTHQLTCSGWVRFDGTLVRQKTPSFALVHGPQVVHPERTVWNSKTFEFTATFSLDTLDIHGEKVLISEGDYILQVLQASGKALPASIWVTCSAPLERTLPREIRVSGCTIVLSRKLNQGGLGVGISRPPGKQTLSLAVQHKLAMQAFTVDRELEESFFLESFNGQTVSDSPKALDRQIAERYPELPRYWTVRDFSVAVPDGAIPLVMYSPEWFEKLSRARYLINNNNFPHFFRKHPDQVYLQTWHGTPLKKIGNDVPAGSLSNVYRALMKREAEHYWDLLVAQSPWAKDVLSTAFGFSGEVIDSGYPRNDALLSDNASLTRQEIRQKLGIRSDQVAVLYAPTWRDNKRGANGQYEQPVHLDSKKIASEFGDSVVVLVRAHVNTSSNPMVLRGGNTIDVSGLADVNDLYLASDLLVTDYSSVMFDYVVTGKPMYFLAPDLAEYRDNLRGFYFDFEVAAPGPILATTEELCAYIKDPSRNLTQIARRHEEFRRVFASYDDGRSTERVLNSLLAGNARESDS